jgi:MoaA/NifB/PqqE/SkfB family radical SAM enzyme
MCPNANKIKSKIINKFNQTRKYKRNLCNAPFVSLSIDIAGFVSPCCYMHSQTEYLINNSDRYPEKKLIDIWKGNNFAKYRHCFTKKIIPKECIICKNDIISEQFDRVKINMYDKYQPNPEYPRIIELAIDNTCNLKCVMCSSIHSSQIARKNNVVIKNKINDSDFLAEFNEFIPFLEEVIFSGGEPFLSPLYISLMKNILSTNPNCLISVNTNGTVLTDEIKQLMEKGTFHFNLSLDSVCKLTYEQIRIGANFETVMKNIEYLSDYSVRVKNPISVPVCPLVLNYKELPELVRFCNRHSFFIRFVHLFNAHEVALFSANNQLLEDALQLYESVEFSVDDDVQKQNLQRFQNLIEKVKLALIFNQQKEDFIKKLHTNEEEFLKANNLLEEKMKTFLTNRNFKNVDEELINWRNRKDQLFFSLPDFYRCELLYKPIFDFPEEILLIYFGQLPMNELKNYFITFGNEIIKAKS